MDKSRLRQPESTYLALAVEDGKLTAATRTGATNGESTRTASVQELPALFRRADRILVYSLADWQQAARHARSEEEDERVVALGPVTAILMPWLTCYRWPNVLSEMGLAPGGAQKLFDLCSLLAEHARRAPSRLRALWATCLTPGQAQVIGLEPQAVPGADLAAIAAVALRETTPHRRRSIPASVTDDELVDLTEAVFAEGGSLAKAHPLFEPREGQRFLARCVAEALARDEFLLAEAGTGIGKSLAYLVPSALWAMAGHRPVVVATFTRNLQDQLRDRDVPLLKAALKSDLDVLVVKGRSNYPCVRRILDRLAEAAQTLFHEGFLAAAFLTSRALQAPGADLESVSPEASELIPDLAEAVEDVRAHYHTCAFAAGLPCPTEQCCALRRLRSAAENSDIIITNQALLMADLSRDLLPDYGYLVIDEAHHLEEAATGALKASFGTSSLIELQRWLTADERGRGVVRAMTDAERLLGTAVGWISQARETWQEWLGAWEEATAHLETSVVALLEEKQPMPQEPATLLIDAAVRAGDRWATVEEHAAALGRQASQAAQTLRQCAAGMEEAAHDSGVDLAGQTIVLGGTATALAAVAATVELILLGEARDVVWAEAEPQRHGVRWSLCVAPVEVADALARKLYQPLRAIIFTGATLTADRSFAFLRRSCGLDVYAHRVVEVQIPSPFDWKHRLLLCLPKDMPEPGSEEHERTVVEVIWRMAEAAGGGLLALFTARRRMLAAFEALERPLRAAGLSVLCQDVSGERWWLMDRMRADPRTVVFGLRSLWEGVDVPGQHLRCVIVEKLPFAVPDEPLVAARSKYLDEQGVDGYNSYYVPEAIRALRQAVGRVLRTTKDYGVVFILDPRIHTRPYGRRFLRSLPPATICATALDEALARAGAWLASPGATQDSDTPPPESP
ncbi:MAG: hypothetical protein N2512_03570 [Armatimonadetes bacterium]|nr:hypothetical protein [Armatimonadota bacterium]